MKKADLRKQMLDARRKLGEDSFTRLNSAILDRFLTTFDLNEFTYLHCYLPIKKFNEVNTWLLLDRIWVDYRHLTTAAPRIGKSGALEHLKITSASELVENSWGIFEPRVPEKIKPEKFDMVVVPLLAFDETGNRVGYGKGFYDRFLVDCRADCLKVGLSYFPPVEQVEDANEKDVRLDFCLTPDKSYSF